MHSSGSGHAYPKPAGKLVLFGVGSSLVIDYEETCRRLGVTVVAAIRNRAGPTFLLSQEALITVEQVDDDLRSIPCICPLFTPANRRIAAAEAAALGFSFAPPVVDPTAVIASSVRLGRGTYVNAACVLGGASSFGAQVVVNRGASVGHHVEIDDFASIGPSAVLAAAVRVARGAMIGAGAVVLPGVRVGEHAVVGAGAVVTRNVPDRHVVVGNPARTVSAGRRASE